MATPDKSLFHEVEDLNPSKEEQERIRRKQAVAKLQDSPAIQKQIRKTRVAKDQVKVRDQSRKTNARLEAERKAKLKAKEDAKKNTVNYSDATKPKKTTPEKKPAKKGLFGEGDAKTRNGKANVSRKQLSDFGGTLTQYMNQWNKSGKRPTKVSKDASGSGTKTDAPAKKTFRQRRAANLKAKIADENVGERRKRRLKRRLGRVERRMAQGKAGGGMMKSKMSSKGGKMGGKMVRGYKDGDEVKKTENKKVRYVLKKRKEEDKVSNYTPNPGNKKARYVLKERKDKNNSNGKMTKNMNEGGEAKVKKPNRRAVLKSLMTIGKRKAQELHGKAAVNQAVKDLNQISGVTPTKKVKTEKEKKLAGADARASMTRFTKQTPAAKKQAQVNKTEKRLERGFKGGGVADKARGMGKGTKKMNTGGMAKKGYSKGGAVKKKSKPRGVGVALRGYGKAMR